MTTEPAPLTIDAESLAAWLAGDFPRELSDRTLVQTFDWLQGVQWHYDQRGAALPEPERTMLRAYGAEIDRRLALKREA